MTRERVVVHRIAIVGAGSTGKTTLANELAAQLRERGLRALAVPQALRAWCERAGRAPRLDEQLAIAREQEEAVDAAAGRADFVIADTTALMVAIRAGMLHEDGELYRFALARQRTYEATLLTGLDLAGQPEGLHRDTTYSREQVDALVRTLLERAAVPYQVVYGQGPQRLRSAVQALAALGVLPAAMAEQDKGTGERGQRWAWVCDKCSDPACEHRLFTQTREARQEPNPGRAT